MGGFINPSSTIGGTASSPKPHLDSTPYSGIFQTNNAGIGMTLGGNDAFELNSGNFFLGSKPTQNFGFNATPASPFLSASSPRSICITPNGAFVITVSSIIGVSVFSRNSISGDLKPVKGSPFVAGNYPVSAVISKDGNFVFVLNSNSWTVSVFEIDGNGALKPIAGSPFAVVSNPALMAISPDGNYLAVTSAATVHIYSISAGGALAEVISSPIALPSTATSIYIVGTHVYVCVATSSIAAFSLANDGSLTPVIGSPFLTGNTPTGSYSRLMCASNDNNYLFVACPNDGDVWVYSINSNGVISPIIGSPFIVGNTPLNIVLSPDGSHAFVSNYGGGSLSVFSVNNGYLTPIAGSPFTTIHGAADGPYDAVVSPDNNFVYFAYFGSNGIGTYSLSPSPTYNLITANFDNQGKLGGTVNINGSLLAQGLPILSSVATDKRYASIGGNNLLPFSASSLKVSESVNGKQGVATLVNGTVTILNGSITASSRIFISAQDGGILAGTLRVSARIPGTSFTVSSSVVTDSAVFAYEIFEVA